MLFIKLTQVIGVWCFIALLMSSCKVADMRQDESLLIKATHVPVEGRVAWRPNKDFQIGPYAVRDVRRGWVRESGLALFNIESQRKSQRFEFVLQDSAGLETYVACQAGLSTDEVRVGKVFSVNLGDENREVFVSTIRAGSSGVWKLTTKDPGNDILFRGFSGMLVNGDTHISIEPVYHFQKNNYASGTEILGYTFKSGIEPLGSVQVKGKGKVLFSKDLSPEQQRVRASASAALMLYRKLNQPNSSEPQNPRVKLPLSIL